MTDQHDQDSPLEAAETTARDRDTTPTTEQAAVADEVTAQDVTAQDSHASAGHEDNEKTTTTDELPKPPSVGPVEVIEPEARRVPHPPAFAQNGDHHHGGTAGGDGEGSVIEQLSDLIADRAASPRKGSYTNSLLADPIKAQRKMMEEAFETCLELHTPTALVDHDALASEAADLVFHMLVALRTQGLGWAEVEAKLVDRLGKPARHSTYTQ